LRSRRPQRKVPQPPLADEPELMPP
jgi:hypothetical protein